MATHPIPAGYHSITPYLVVSGAAGALEFYRRAFGATELMKLGTPDGKILHAEIRIGDAPVMLADEFPEAGFRSAASIGNTPVILMLYVEDADATFERAIEAGATAIRPVADQFYGDRSGVLRDPFGHVWNIATFVEDVSPEEMKKRFAALESSNG
jgi:PhnB protein